MALNDPEFADDRVQSQSSNEDLHCTVEVTRSGATRKSQYRDPRILLGWKSKGVGEIKVKRDQATPLGSADFDHSGVYRAGKSLVAYGGDFVSRLDEGSPASFA